MEALEGGSISLACWRLGLMHINVTRIIWRIFFMTDVDAFNFTAFCGEILSSWIHYIAIVVMLCAVFYLPKGRS